MNNTQLINQKIYDKKIMPLFEELNLDSNKAEELIYELMEYLDKDALQTLAKESIDIVNEMES